MKKIIFHLTFILTVFSLLKIVSGAGIVGVSPGNVNFIDVLRGGYAERFVTITLDSENPIKIDAQARGEIENWLEFPSNLTISKNNPGRFLIAVKPPTDVPNGNYTGFIRITTDAIDGQGQEGHATSTIRAAIDISVRVEITDLEILACRAQGFTVQSTEKGDDILFNVNVLNQGNIRIRPDIVVEIWDQEQITIVKTTEFRSEEILPTREEKLSFTLPTNDFDLDQYWVEISVPDCFASDTLTFDVLEPGALKSQGILRKIASRVWAEVDETFPIIADFENIGEKNVDAQFKGQITREGKIIQVLESEETNVPLGELTNFTFFFTPEKAGKYIASGRVFYDKKRTFESSTVINVNPKSFGLKQLTLSLLYIALMVIIAILFVKIRKEKRRYLNKIKQIRNT